MNRKPLIVLPVMAAMAVGVTACGSDSSDSASADKATSPKVTVSSPGNGESVGSRFTAKVALSDFQIDPKAVGKKAVDGHGHIHFSLDGGKFDSAKYSGANGKLAQQLGTDGKYSPSVAPQITYSGIPAGKHTLVVDLANNDHSDTGQKATVRFTVEGSDQAQTGKNGETVAFKNVEATQDGLTANVKLGNVELDPKQVGKMAEAGHGHLHFSLDDGKFDSAKYSGANGKLAEQLGTDGKYSPSVTPTITYSNIPAGKHVLKVYVANNDHSETGAVATRTITVG
jgi:hypothetical protein